MPQNISLNFIIIDPGNILANACVDAREICLCTAYAPGYNAN